MDGLPANWTEKPVPGDLVIFYDPKGILSVDEGGFNQVGVVVNDGVILSRYRAVHKLGVTSHVLKYHSHLVSSAYGELRKSAVSYFESNISHPLLFQAGLNHIMRLNFEPFKRGALFPVKPEYSSEDAYAEAWSVFKAALEPADAIFIRNSQSKISNMISWITHGPFSHVALYMGGGELAESTVPDLRKGPLEIYYGQQFWVAAYRQIDANSNRVVQRLTENNLKFVVDDWFQKGPRGYNYVMAAWHGLRCFFGDLDALVPNTMLYSGEWRLVGQV